MAQKLESRANTYAPGTRAKSYDLRDKSYDPRGKTSGPWAETYEQGAMCYEPKNIAQEQKKGAQNPEIRPTEENRGDQVYNNIQR